MARGWIIVLTVVLFFIGDRLGGSLLEHVLYQSPQRFPSLYGGRLDGDIVCIGNSRGVYALDLAMVEDRTGRSIVNISHNGMTPQIALALFSDYLEHNRKPELLIVELSFITTRTTPGVALDYKPFWNRSERLRKLSEGLSHRSVVASQLFHLYRYNSEIFLRAVAYWLRGKSDQAGFMNKDITPDLVAKTEQLETFRFKTVPEELDALKQLIALAHKEGIEVQVVLAPYLPIYAERISNLGELINDFTKSTGLEVMDMSTSIQPTDHFADRVHVNRRGTQAHTELLIRSGIFEPKRDPGQSNP
jgi:hypothetical protein